ncbi:hypothetical protein, partial [Bradyrhizobium sp. SZCCHNS3052]|uniref:hypothetical protein n=1 Tax=Bradyrhizobium sp. SZCCHNS3052 TaxID=3057321 RepID=UPI002916404B
TTTRQFVLETDGVHDETTADFFNGISPLRTSDHIAVRSILSQMSGARLNGPARSLKALASFCRYVAV